MRTVIGVDAGGTSTKALLVDATGLRCGAGRSGPGNPTSAGADRAARHWLEATLAAWGARTDAALEPPAAVVVTAAGVPSDEVRSTVAAGLAAAGLSSTVESVGDALGAYFSAASEPDGAVIIVGTGTTAAQVVGGELARTADGLGWLLGDAGSGFWIGREVLRAVAADLDGQGPRTALTPLLLADIELPDIEPVPWRPPTLTALVSWTYARRPVELAAHAPLVLQAAGDPVADAIVAEASRLVLSRVERMMADDGPLVLTGGLLGEGSPIAAALAARWPGRCRRAADGTAGAALLALRRAGVDAGPSHLARVRGEWPDPDTGVHHLR